MINRMRDATALLLFLLLAAVPEARGAESVSSTELRAWQENKTSFYLVDVRSGQLFNRKHIEGAINIPAFIVHKKGLSKSGTVVLYDAGIGAVEAKEAAEKMSAAGYTAVFVLEGGLARWEAAGLPLKAQMGVLDARLVEFISAAELARAKSD